LAKQQAKPKITSWKERKIRIEINEMKTQRTVQRINEVKSWFSKKISKTHKPLAKLTKRKRKLKLIKLGGY
jgi:hypothetical protein